MSDFGITISAGRADELEANLKRAGKSFANLREEMNDIGSYLSLFFAGEVFASRGRVIAEPWAPLQDRYAAWKARKFPGRPPLVKSGRLQRGYKFRSTALSTRLFNETSYFDYHQEGNGVPERVTMKIDARRAQAITKLLENGIEKNLRQAGV